MNSTILQLASKYIKALLMTFAVIALLRGHNYPGGGFIGGLLAALAIVFDSLAFSIEKTRKTMRLQPEGYMSIGILLILLSFLPSIVKGKTLMTGVWTTLSLPLTGELKLGTPFLFDIGVFMTVIGVTLMFFFILKETGIKEKSWK